jgi:membrane associated rhomboid family serine protease
MQFRYGSMTPVVKNIIIINVLMLIITYVFESRFNTDLNHVLGLHYFSSTYFQPYQFLTHMFMHGGITHLFFNMFALWMFGKVLESVWGSKRFLLYYFVTGLGAAALHTFVNHLQIEPMVEAFKAFSNTPSPDAYAAFIKEHVRKPDPQVYDFLAAWGSQPNNPEYTRIAISQLQNYLTFTINIPTVGASGAVFGVLLAFGMLFPNTQLMLLIPPIPIKAKYFVILYGALELYLGLTRPGSNIAHFAHLGGMLFGFFLIRYWNAKRKDFY